ncbi:hypothetical protein ETB97_012161 [Aspergillus alliaceus]|uniref:Uncharacterized protein n=1 Tax=Petromyces alliaceus TaxID=209559 RepID=A0A8H6E7B5_PETAA|nr:hypothetical protein ETB97_012161 [Aspergillus burnettii]
MKDWYATDREQALVGHLQRFYGRISHYEECNALNKASSLAVIASFGATLVLGASNVANTKASLQTLKDQVHAAKSSLENYNGGFVGTLPVARSLYAAHSSSEIVRKEAEKSDPFTSPEGEELVDTYNEMYPVLLDTMRVAQEKAPQFKEAGVGYVARGMLGNLKREKDDFETVMKGKLSDEHFARVAPSVDEINNAFDATLKAYSA